MGNSYIYYKYIIFDVILERRTALTVLLDFFFGLAILLCWLGSNVPVFCVHIDSTGSREGGLVVGFFLDGAASPVTKQHGHFILGQASAAQKDGRLPTEKPLLLIKSTLSKSPA